MDLAFLRFSAIYAEYHKDEMSALMKYGEIIRDLATKRPGMAFSQYDTQFRLLKATYNEQLPCDHIHPIYGSWPVLRPHLLLLLPFGHPLDSSVNTDVPFGFPTAFCQTLAGVLTVEAPPITQTAPTHMPVVCAEETTMLVSAVPSDSKTEPHAQALQTPSLNPNPARPKSNIQVVTPIKVGRLDNFLIDNPSRNYLVEGFLKVSN